MGDEEYGSHDRDSHGDDVSDYLLAGEVELGRVKVQRLSEEEAGVECDGECDGAEPDTGTPGFRTLCAAAG